MPSCACACSAEMPLEWLVSRWIASNHVRSGSLHDRPGPDRSLPVAARTLPGERLRLQLPTLAYATCGADEPSRPSLRSKIAGTRLLVRKTRIERAPRHRSVMLPPTAHENKMTTYKPPSRGLCGVGCQTLGLPEPTGGAVQAETRAAVRAARLQKKRALRSIDVTDDGAELQHRSKRLWLRAFSSSQISRSKPPSCRRSNQWKSRTLSKRCSGPTLPAAAGLG